MTTLPQTASLAPEIALDLGRLTDALRIAEGGFIAFALFDTFPTRDAMIREIALRLAGEVQIRQIGLTSERPYLHEYLTPPDAGRRGAYFVYGFEGISHQARQQAFGALQVKREAITRLEVPVVLWLAEGNLVDLARRAPDFFSQRGGLYDFRSPDRAPQRAEELSQTIVQMLGTYSLSLFSPEELRKRFMLFEGLLKQSQAEAEPPPEILAYLHFDLGNIHDSLNEWDQALAHYQQAREIRERLGDTAGQAECLGAIGSVYLSQKNYPRAKDFLSQAMSLRPDEAIYHNNLGSALVQLGDFEGAEKEYGLRVFLRPADALNALTSLGVLAYRRGDVEAGQKRLGEALALWEIAWKRRLQSPASLLANLTLVLLGLGQKEQALESLRSALNQLWPSERPEDFLPDFELLAQSPNPPAGIDEALALLRRV